MTKVKIYSTSMVQLIALVLITALSFTSCKKDKETLPGPPSTNNSSVIGLFAGKYGFGNEVPDVPEKYKVKSGGLFEQISIHNGSVVGQGNWQLTGDILTATCISKFAPFNKESMKLIFNSTTGKLSGTWGFDASFTDGGKLELTKQ